MAEYSDIVKCHPLLVLISEKPMTWYGFMVVNKDTRIEIKLRVPHYPELRGASVHFGQQICLFQGSEFRSKYKGLLQNATSVLSFLRQLQGLMEGIIKKKRIESTTKEYFFNKDMLKELKTVLKEPNIEVQGNNDLSAVKIIYKSISVTLKPENTGNSWALISSDLPELPIWRPFDKCISTLMEATKTLQAKVNALEDIWRELAEIDENCWVIDPVNPKPCHLYRRIHINSALSLHIKLNPLDSDGHHPEMKLLGSDKEVYKTREILSDNLCKWDADRSILENIMELLQIEELPQRPPDEPKDDGAIFGDDECCICFSMESENGEIPSEICSNEKCRKHFHSSCLLEWLQTVAGKQMYFARCHGTCPVCKENISCAVKLNFLYNWELI
ncbi:E3 ubiquitin-protein ligase FANCL [Fopius arisanus]|uniref:E3 ubiquitin-protein ligase FANCL n=1 Tax=Fopius arisanus TaxID=64838 RepID=A0A9R1TVD9_9HYME|nr:PREDICTED: E3 ubiquitin-protein ligase FANCL [Fopius arisanus]